MLSKMFGSAKRKVGPVGLSLVAAALTATAFAAVSVAAKDDNGANKNKSRGDVLRAAPGPGGPGGTEMFREELSDSDRQALEELEQCMEDKGAPAPPEPGERSEGEGPPEPPSEADRDKIEKALEACEDKLPEGARAFGGPGGPGCGPPPGASDSATLPAPPNGSSQGQQSAPQSSGAAA